METPNIKKQIVPIFRGIEFSDKNVGNAGNAMRDVSAWICGAGSVERVIVGAGIAGHFVPIHSTGRKSSP